MTTPPPFGYHRQLIRTGTISVRENIARTDRGDHYRGESPAKTAHFQAVDPRAVFDVAVGNHPLRVDHPQ